MRAKAKERSPEGSEGGNTLATLSAHYSELEGVERVENPFSPRTIVCYCQRGRGRVHRTLLCTVRTFPDNFYVPRTFMRVRSYPVTHRYMY